MYVTTLDFHPNYGLLRPPTIVDSFHSHYNALFYHAHPHIHMVMDTLQSMHVSTDSKLNSIRRGRINPRGKDNDPRRAALKNMYEKYTRGTIVTDGVTSKSLGITASQKKFEVNTAP